jgi:hypothetical protein
LSIDRFFTTPVTIITPGFAVDRYDDDVPDWDNPVAQVASMGWLTQVNTTEQIGDRDVVITGLMLFLPSTDVVTVSDRVIANGSIYEVDGDPHYAQTPAGVHHIELRLRYVSEVETEAVS